MSDGTLSVRRRQQKASETSDNAPFSASNVRSGAFESFLGSGIGQGQTKNKSKSRPIGDANEFRIESKRTKRLKDYDRFLKGFKYSAALDSVLRKVNPVKHCCACIIKFRHTECSSSDSFCANTRAYSPRRPSYRTSRTRRRPPRTSATITGQIRH